MKWCSVISSFFQELHVTSKSTLRLRLSCLGISFIRHFMEQFWFRAEQNVRYFPIEVSWTVKPENQHVIALKVHNFPTYVCLRIFYWYISKQSANVKINKTEIHFFICRKITNGCFYFPRVCLHLGHVRATTENGFRFPAKFGVATWQYGGLAVQETLN